MGCSVGFKKRFFDCGKMGWYVLEISCKQHTQRSGNALGDCPWTKWRGLRKSIFGIRHNYTRLAKFMTDDDITERFIERAAIMEFDGGLTKQLGKPIQSQPKDAAK